METETVKKVVTELDRMNSLIIPGAMSEMETTGTLGGTFYDGYARAIRDLLRFIENELDQVKAEINKAV